MRPTIRVRRKQERQACAFTRVKDKAQTEFDGREETDSQSQEEGVVSDSDNTRWAGRLGATGS
jgi:hypothetical protein